MADALDEILATPARGIGDNAPPLAELLVDETAELKRRSDDLIAGAARCVVTDSETAKKAVLLAGMMTDHGKKIEAAREERKRPFLEGGRVVDAHFANLKAPLVGNDPKGKLGGAAAEVVAKADAWRREEDRRVAEERRRLEDEARAAREAQEAAQRAQREAEEASRRAAEEAERRIRAAEEEARKAGDRAAEEKAKRERAEAAAARTAAEAKKIAAEIDARAEAARIETLERQAAATVARPIDTGLGVKAFARTVWTGKIVDLKLALRHALKVEPAAIETAVQGVLDRQVRAKVRAFPGAEITEDTTTRIHKSA